MNRKNTFSVKARFVIALVGVIANITFTPPAWAKTSTETETFALQLVQRAGLSQQAMLAFQGVLWRQVQEAPLSPEANSRKTQLLSSYECVRNEPSTLFESPLTKLITSKMKIDEMKVLLDFYSSFDGSLAVQVMRETMLRKFNLPRTGEYAQLTPLNLSVEDQIAMRRFFDMPAFARMKEVIGSLDQESKAVPQHLLQQCQKPKTNAEIKSAPVLGFPQLARKAGVQGSLVVELLIDAEGKVKHARVIRSWFNSSDMPDGEGGKKTITEVFDEVALAYAKGHIFTPATRAGVAVESVMSLPINFVLQ